VSRRCEGYLGHLMPILMAHFHGEASEAHFHGEASDAHSLGHLRRIFMVSS